MRLVLTTLAVLTAFVVGKATAGGTGFIEIPHSDTARFSWHHDITCTNPKATNVGVGCQVSYVPWRDIRRPVAMKFDISIRSRCVKVGKWSRRTTLLRSVRVC
jgi:hypothetical protein